LWGGTGSPKEDGKRGEGVEEWYWHEDAVKRKKRTWNKLSGGGQDRGRATCETQVNWRPGHKLG